MVDETLAEEDASSKVVVFVADGCGFQQSVGNNIMTVDSTSHFCNIILGCSFLLLFRQYSLEASGLGDLKKAEGEVGITSTS